MNIESSNASQKAHDNALKDIKDSQLCQNVDTRACMENQTQTPRVDQFVR